MDHIVPSVASIALKSCSVTNQCCSFATYETEMFES